MFHKTNVNIVLFQYVHQCQIKLVNFNFKKTVFATKHMYLPFLKPTNKQLRNACFFYLKHVPKNILHFITFFIVFYNYYYW